MPKARVRPLPSAPHSLAAILDAAWGATSLTATSLMEATGLTRTTTIEAVNRLIEAGLIGELPNAREAGTYAMGRPSRRFAFAPDAGLTLGIDAGHSHLTLTLADLTGAVLARRRLPLSTSLGARERAAEILAHARRFLQAQKVESRRVWAACVGVPAPVDAAGLTPHGRDPFWDLVNPDLGDRLAPIAAVTRVDNDAALAALAEGAIGSATGCDHYVTLLANNRLGCGIVSHGRLLRGAHGGAGELFTLALVPEVGGTEGLATRLRALAPPHPDETGPGCDDVAGVLAAAAAGQTWAVQARTRAAEALARVGAILTLVDPELIVISGTTATTGDPLVAHTRDLLDGLVRIPPPRIEISHLGPDVVALGAVRGAVDLARSHALEIALARS